MLQGVLLSFADKDEESDYRAECASESFGADCGLYMLALSLWVIIWQTLYFAGDWRHVWSAANAVMCFGTLLGMRWAVPVLHLPHMPCSLEYCASLQLDAELSQNASQYY